MRRGLGTGQVLPLMLDWQRVGHASVACLLVSLSAGDVHSFTGSPPLVKAYASMARARISVVKGRGPELTKSRFASHF